MSRCALNIRCKDSRADGAVTLLLFQSGANTVHADVAAEKQRARVVDNSMSVREDETWGSAKSCKKSPYSCPISQRDEIKTRAFLQQDRDKLRAFGQIFEKAAGIL